MEGIVYREVNKNFIFSILPLKLAAPMLQSVIKLVVYHINKSCYVIILTTCNFVTDCSIHD